MKKDFLNRYERDRFGRLVVDVTADRMEDLFNDFDRSTPYVRRDLDQDLVDYLIDCARELSPEPFAIRFTLASAADKGGQSRIRRSINNFFLYLVAVEKLKIRGMMRTSVVLLCIGVAILFVSVWVNRWVGADRTVVGHVFAEGLTVAAWVSLWEALATFLIEWFPHRKEVRLFRRLAGCDLIFRSQPEVNQLDEES